MRNLKSLVGVLAIFFFCSVSASALTEDVESLFKFGNQNYRTGKYQEAIKNYQSVLELDPRNSVAYYNLGNAYYRTKKIGPAIVAYERARVLDPRNPDIRYNLSFVSGQLEYRVKDTRNWYVKAWEGFLAYAQWEECLLFFEMSLFLLILSNLFVAYYRKGLAFGWLKKLWRVLIIFSTLLLTGKVFESRLIHHAIMIEKEAPVHYGPSDIDQVAFKLGEGIKVYVVDRNSEWSRINLTSGEGGWIRNSKFKEIEVFPSGGL